MRRTAAVGRGALVTLLALILLAACSSGSSSLRDWAGGEFSGSDGRYTTSDSPNAVEQQFIDYRRPIDRYDTEGRIFLQYSDDIVAILPGTGDMTSIEIDGSRTGRQNHFLFIGNRWGNYQSFSDTARGGGPGSGK